MDISAAKLIFLTMMIENLLVLGFPPNLGQPTKTETVVDEQSRLLNKILTGYDKRILPQINDSVPVRLSIGVRLIDLVDLFEHEEVLETSVYIQQLWTDFRLSWEPSRFKRIHVIHVPVDELWQPDIALFNNADVRLETMNTLAIVFSNGQVYYSPKARVRTRCEMDMKNFPFDEQLCSIKFGSFTYDGNKINLTMHQENSTFDLSEYSDNKEWHLTAAPATIVTKTYECCPDQPYQYIQFHMKLQRKPVYYTHVFILPAVVIAILVPFQFLLPPDCGERLTIGSTLILGSAVLIAMIQNFLPEAHPNLPYIVQYYCLTMVWIALSIVFSIWVINTQNRGPRKRKVPGIIRQLFLKSLKKLVCVNEDSYHPLDDTETVSFRNIEKQTINNADAKSDASKLEKDVDEILKQVNTLVTRTAIAESRRGVRTEWFQVALVFDRIMCFLFLLIFVVYSCVLLS